MKLKFKEYTNSEKYSSSKSNYILRSHSITDYRHGIWGNINASPDYSNQNIITIGGSYAQTV